MVVIIIVGMVVRAEGINFIKLTIMIHTLTTMMVTVPLTLTIQIMTRPLLLTIKASQKIQLQIIRAM